MNQVTKAIAYWVLIVVSAVLLWKVVQTNSSGNEQEITFSDFMQSVDRGDIAAVTLAGTDAHGRYKTGQNRFHTTVPANYSLILDDLRSRGVTITIKENSINWPTYLLNLSPLILFGALWFVMIRGMQRANRKRGPLTYEAVTAPDIPAALQKANEMSREGWRAVSISAGNSSPTAVVVLMEK